MAVWGICLVSVLTWLWEGINIKLLVVQLILFCGKSFYMLY